MKSACIMASRNSNPIMQAAFWAAYHLGKMLWCVLLVKPTSSILNERKTITKSGENTDIITKGRHDPCVGIRAVPVGEAMMAIVLADAFLRTEANGLNHQHDLAHMRVGFHQCVGCGGFSQRKGFKNSGLAFASRKQWPDFFFQFTRNNRFLGHRTRPQG